MTISKSPVRLDSEEVERDDVILEGWIKDVQRNLNAMFEALFDRYAPGGVAADQAYSGHDHAVGGGPICRGVAWSEDGGATYMFLYTPTVAKQKSKLDLDHLEKSGGLARYYGSPLFAPGALLAGRIYYTATDSKFTLTFVEVSGNALSTKSEEVSVILETTGETGQWVDFNIPLNPGVWNQLEVYAENETHDGTTDPVLTIYSICITEAPGVTRYKPSLLLSRLDGGGAQTANASDLTYAAFEAMANEMANDEYWMDTDLLSRIQWCQNGLWEGILDSMAPGRDTQTCRGHDHEDYGGLAITRNKVCAISLGSKLSQPFAVQAGVGEGGNTAPSLVDPKWILADRDTVPGGLRSSANIPHMVGPVGPAIANTGTASPPYLDAMVYVMSNPSTSIRVAIYNRNQAAFSAVAATSLGWIYIDQIPCAADTFNEFDIYVQSTADSVTLSISYCQISESADVSGARVARVLSTNGVSQLGIAPQGGL